MNTYAKILATTLPLVFVFLIATFGTTYLFSRQAITDLTETWLETRLSEAMQIVTTQEKILHIYGLEAVPASRTKAKLDAGAAMAAIEVGREGYVFAVDARGVIDAHRDPARVGADISGEAWFKDLKPGRGRVAYHGPEGRALARFDYFEPWQWFVLAVDPEREVYAVAHRMRPYLLALGITGALVLALVLMLLTRRITDPLRQLTAGAERIGRGDLQTRIPVRSRDEFGRLAGVFNQMTVQMQETLTRLQHREDHFRSLIENASDIVTVLDAEGVMVYESPSIERILGYPPEAVIGRSYRDFLHPEEREGIARLLAMAIRRTGSWTAREVRIRHRDGSWRILETTGANLLDHPAVAGVVVNSRDVTARKRAEENLKKSHQELEQRVSERTAELFQANRRLQREVEERRNAEAARRSSEQRMKAILRASPVGIGLIVNRVLDWANEAMYAMVGYDKDALVGRGAEILYADRAEYERVGRELYARIADGRIGQAETRWIRRDGTAFDCKIRAYSLYPDDPSKGQIVAVTDTTEARRLEAKLRRARKMEALGTLAGGVAHDLNNILSGIVSYPELLLMDLPPDSPLRTPILTIQNSGERAAVIVQDLLTMARRGVAVTEVLDLNRIVTEQLDSPEFGTLASFHPNVSVASLLEKELMHVRGSEAHLAKCVMNLVANAAEAMPEGGEIRVETRNVYIDRPIRGYENVEEGDYVAVAVSDTGVGLTETEMERIFEPFYTRKKMQRSGSGLGMAVVWGTVKDHNGYIDIRSAQGRGSTFTLYLPVTREGLADACARLPVETYRGAGETVLVVDDSESQREIATRILSKLGYRAESVASGEEAVDRLRQRPVDLLVLDMIMPPGMDGLDTYRRILALRPGQRAIIASGFSETARVREAQQMGAGRYIKKPYTIEKFGTAVKEAIACGKP